LKIGQYLVTLSQKLGGGLLFELQCICCSCCCLFLNSLEPGCSAYRNAVKHFCPAE